MFNTKKILIIEDDQAFATVVSEILAQDEFSVSVSATGLDGLNRALAEHPDLIILDIILPDMSGVDVLKEIRFDPWGETVPVMFLTNLSPDDAMVKKTLESKAAYYLVKSDTSLEDLLEKVKVILNI